MKLHALVLAALTAFGAMAGTALACERHEAMACAQGQSYDAGTHSCVPKTGT